MDLDLDEDLAGLEAEIGRFADRELRPRVRDFERAGAWDASVLKTLDGFALAALDLPESWGGTGSGALAKAVALEALAAGDAGGLPAADRCGPATGVAQACPDAALAREVVAACAAGEARQALLVGPAGRVTWAPGAEAPEWTWVSDGDALRLLDTRGCGVAPTDAAAFHASGGVSYSIAAATTAGEWTVPDGAAARGRARLWPAAVALGVARASLDYAVAYARERIVMGKPVAHHQGNAFAIAEAAAALDAARLSVRAAAHGFDTAAPAAGLAATLSWMDATETARRVTDLGVQLLGGHGYIEDHPAEKWFREARALGLLWGGLDAALDDAREQILDAPDPLVLP